MNGDGYQPGDALSRAILQVQLLLLACSTAAFAAGGVTYLITGSPDAAGWVGIGVWMVVFMGTCTVKAYRDDARRP